MEKRQFNSLIIEFGWSIPATLLMFAALFSFGPRRGFRLRGTSILASICGALAYSWVRWGLELVHLRISDGPDFCLAMMLAASAGVATSLARSKQNSTMQPARTNGST
jgi:hypothetical protein